MNDELIDSYIKRTPNKRLKFQCKICNRHFGYKFIIETHIAEHLKRKHCVPLKPWNDPESLFCSPKLSEITKKEIKPCNQEGDQ